MTTLSSNFTFLQHSFWNNDVLTVELGVVLYWYQLYGDSTISKLSFLSLSFILSWLIHSRYESNSSEGEQFQKLWQCKMRTYRCFSSLKCDCFFGCFELGGLCQCLYYSTIPKSYKELITTDNPKLSVLLFLFFLFIWTSLSSSPSYSLSSSPLSKAQLK